MQELDVQVVRPPVTIGASAGAACERALARVVVSLRVHRSSPLFFGFFRDVPTTTLRNLFHQVKLTLMIAAIGFSDEEYHTPATRYFDALAHHGHFGRAAETCAISQPALSMQIKELEEALGGVLLERSARQVALTRFGEELARRARDILRSVDELGDFARASRERLSGRLRLGMIPTIAPYLLPKVIENLARMHPELDIHVPEL